MDDKVFSRDFWRPLTLIEFGFLWSVFFAAWGPVLRYFGWLLALIGIGFELYKGTVPKHRLHPFVKTTLLFILLWGFPVTLAKKPDLFLFLKGYSLAMEFAFSIWLASRVYSGKMLKKFWAVFSVSIVLAVAHTFFNFLQDSNFAGLFSNINTLGIYGVIVLPFALSHSFEKKGFLSLLFSVAVLFTVCLSSSSAAWITSACSILLMVILGGKKFFSRTIILGASFIIVFILVWAGLSKFDPKLASGFENYMRRELTQLTSFNNPVKFTSNRSYIWRGAVDLVKEAPVIGWGWGEFDEPFENVNGEWWKKEKVKASIKHQSDAHNMYLNLAVYGGIPTVAAVVSVFLYAAWRAFAFFRKNNVSFGWFWLAACVLISSQFVYSLAGDIFSARNTFACTFWYLLGFVSISPRFATGRNDKATHFAQNES
ncbi:MAG: O-antigen ligase family protein [Aminivibrio sp.]